MDLRNANIAQLLIPIETFDEGVGLAEFSDPDHNQLALMSEVAVA